MSRSNLISFFLGLAASAAILLSVLPIHKYTSSLDGQSLKVIIFAHNAAYGHWLDDNSDITLPAAHVQFLENYDVELLKSGDQFTVRYSPRDTRIRGGAYNIVIANDGGELTLEKTWGER